MSVAVSELGPHQFKSSIADRMLNGERGGRIQKRGSRRTEISIPINDDPDGPAVLMSLENSHGRVRFHHHDTVTLYQHPKAPR